MENSFLIVLFKNRKKRKIIKRYATEKKANDKFDQLIKDNNTISFEKVYENAEPCDYELGLVTNTTKIQKSLFMTDELGRNIPVNLENSDFVFLKINKYKVEDQIYDWQTSSKISFNDFIKKYCSGGELKSVYTLNNKICVQKDEDVQIFSLKNSEESERFLNIVQEYFYNERRLDAFFVRDISNAQRKWIYDVLNKKGFDKQRLYRLKTTFSKR
jgi:hypothetical protein